MTVSDEHCIERLDVSVYTIPTDAPEADGTLAWNSTSVVVVEPHTRGGTVGLGYAFADKQPPKIRPSLAGEVAVASSATASAKPTIPSELPSTNAARENDVSRRGRSRRAPSRQPRDTIGMTRRVRNERWASLKVCANVQARIGRVAESRAHRRLAY